MEVISFCIPYAYFPILFWGVGQYYFPIFPNSDDGKSFIVGSWFCVFWPKDSDGEVGAFGPAV